METAVRPESKMTAGDVLAALSRYWPDDQYLHIYEAPLDSGRQGNKIDVAVFALWRSKGLGIDAVEVKVSYSDWRNEWQRVEWVLTDFQGRRRPSSRQWSEESLNYYRGSNRVVGEDDYSRRLADRRGVPPDFEPTVERVVTIDTQKSARWRAKAHRFWIASPMKLARKIAEDVQREPALEGWGVLGVDENGTRVLVKPAKRAEPPEPLTHQQWLGLLRTAADSGFKALLRAEARGERRAREAMQAEMERGRT